MAPTRLVRRVNPCARTNNRAVSTRAARSGPARSAASRPACPGAPGSFPYSRSQPCCSCPGSVVLRVLLLPATYRSGALGYRVGWLRRPVHAAPARGGDHRLAPLRLFEGTATSAATLLFIDAWFDVLTASTGTKFSIALSEAIVVEVRSRFSVCLSHATPTGTSSRQWRRRRWQQSVEPLWSPGVANGGNPRQRLSLGKPAKRVIIFAVVCDRMVRRGSAVRVRERASGSS